MLLVIVILLLVLLVAVFVGVSPLNETDKILNSGSLNDKMISATMIPNETKPIILFEHRFSVRRSEIEHRNWVHIFSETNYK